MCRITILELFPLYSTCRKWGNSSTKEIVRLEKEFTIVTTTKDYEEYRIDKKLFRKDGPAHIWYHKNGRVYYESWWINEKLHRKDGPAYIWNYENGQIRESWFLNGKKHRKDAPAYIEYYEYDRINYYEEWWINNKFIKGFIR